MSNQKKDIFAMTETDIMVSLFMVLYRYSAERAMLQTEVVMRNLELMAIPTLKWRSKLLLGSYAAVVIPPDWSFDHLEQRQDFDGCMHCSITFGQDRTETSRIIGYDKITRRVVTQCGTVYQLS